MWAKPLWITTVLIGDKGITMQILYDDDWDETTLIYHYQHGIGVIARAVFMTKSIWCQPIPFINCHFDWLKMWHVDFVLILSQITTISCIERQPRQPSRRLLMVIHMVMVKKTQNECFDQFCKQVGKGSSTRLSCGTIYSGADGRSGCRHL